MKMLILLLALVTISHSIIFSQGCLPEGINFEWQEQVDNFQNNYPGCTEIEGNVTIGILEVGSDISNLNGLSGLISIDGDLVILWNYVLENLNGLNNIISIGGNLIITENYVLNSLTGLENISTVGGDIEIISNEYLNDMSALENIDPNSISNLKILGNHNLSDCDIHSICEYLVSPNGFIYINDNAPGCNSVSEVEQHCLTTVEKNPINYVLILSPNPATSFITINVTGGQPIEEAIIYNHFGQKALVAVPVNNTVDVSRLRPGMYILEVEAENRTIREILLVE